MQRSTQFLLKAELASSLNEIKVFNSNFSIAGHTKQTIITTVQLHLPPEEEEVILFIFLRNGHTTYSSVQIF